MAYRYRQGGGVLAGKGARLNFPMMQRMQRVASFFSFMREPSEYVVCGVGVDFCKEC